MAIDNSFLGTKPIGKLLIKLAIPTVVAQLVNIAVMRKFVLLLPLIYLMPKLISDPTMGIYTAEPVADFVAVTFTAILFTVTFKRSIRRIQPT